MLNWLGSLCPDWLVSRSDDDEGHSSDESDPETRPQERAYEGENESVSWDELLDGRGISKQRVWMDLGLSPDEFLVELICRAGGRMWQADIVNTTGWSKSTVSRHLGELESSGTIERVQIGRRKLVGVPGEMPDEVVESEDSASELLLEQPSEPRELV
jgi:hypothetical protein